jgi:peroxiredoxin
VSCFIDPFSRVCSPPSALARRRSLHFPTARRRPTSRYRRRSGATSLPLTSPTRSRRAFTKGCTIEAHDFADAIDQYKALNATVIGVSHDQLDTLQKFSVSECRSKFAVAADTDQAVEKAYDSILAVKPQYANRTSYVIAQNGTIVYSYTSLDPSEHVANTIAALKTLENKQ